nr:hypothetical protein Iba_chr12aCG9320 [Ipomoea batatas]
MIAKVLLYGSGLNAVQLHPDEDFHPTYLSSSNMYSPSKGGDMSDIDNYNASIESLGTAGTQLREVSSPDQKEVELSGRDPDEPNLYPTSYRPRATISIPLPLSTRWPPAQIWPVK